MMIATGLLSLVRLRSQSIAPINPRDVAQFIPMHKLAGVRLTRDDVLQIGAVWACCNVITKAIVCSRFNVFTVDAQRRRTYYPNDALDWILNTRPNPEMTALAFLQCMMFQALIDGNAYAEIVRTEGGQVAELWPLPVDSVTLERSANGELVYRVKVYGKEDVILPQRRVFHLRGTSLSGLMGENMVFRCARSLAIAVAADTFAASYFSNNTVIGGMLKYPKRLDDDVYKRMQESWKEKHSTPGKAHSPIILEDGMEWHPIETDAQKSQIIETRKFSVEEIARFYDVPPHKIQHLDRATFNNIEHLGIEFADSVKPWALAWKQEGDYKLVAPRAPKQIEVDTSWLLRGDSKQRAESNQILRRNGVLNANEWREREGMNSIGPDGDRYIVESNMQPLDSMVDANGDDASIAEESAVRMLAFVLERYRKRAENRRVDLAKQGISEERIASNLAAEREKSLATLISDSADPLFILASLVKRAVDSGCMRGLADRIDLGEPPRFVAESFVRSFNA